MTKFEHRAIERISIAAKVVLTNAAGDKTAHGEVTDISVGGIALTCSERFAAGERVRLEIAADEDERAGIKEHFRATLEVLRVCGDAPPYTIAGALAEVSLP